MNPAPKKEGAEQALQVFVDLLKHRDSLEMREPREVTDKHLLPVPFAPATWEGLREVVAALLAAEKDKLRARQLLIEADGVLEPYSFSDGGDGESYNNDKVLKMSEKINKFLDTV